MGIKGWKGIPMRHRRVCACLILALALMAAPALAQQQEHQQQHPPAAAAPGPGMPGGAMAGTGDMPMMGMMRMMMGRDGMSGMPMMGCMTGHVEGRPGFLKTEVKITHA